MNATEKAHDAVARAIAYANAKRIKSGEAIEIFEEIYWNSDYITLKDGRMLDNLLGSGLAIDSSTGEKYIDMTPFMDGWAKATPKTFALRARFEREVHEALAREKAEAEAEEHERRCDEWEEWQKSDIWQSFLESEKERMRKLRAKLGQ